jgi:hypothetical protein
MATTGGAGRSRRNRSAKASEQAAAEETGNNAVEKEETMAEQEKATTNGGAGQAPKSGKLDLAQKPDAQPAGQEEAGLVLRAEAPGEIEVAESFTSAGIRPIAASHMEIFGTILNNRPIMASHLKVMEYSIPGHRPVFASDMVICDDLTLPGGRPIIASDPHLLQASLLMGGRPIASNEIDDSETLMGFID